MIQPVPKIGTSDQMHWLIAVKKALLATTRWQLVIWTFAAGALVVLFNVATTGLSISYPLNVIVCVVIAVASSFVIRVCLYRKTGR